MDSTSWNKQLVLVFQTPQAKKSQELYPLMCTACWLAHTHPCLLHEGYDSSSKLLDPSTHAIKAHVACIEIFGLCYHSQPKTTNIFLQTYSKPPPDPHIPTPHRNIPPAVSMPSQTIQQRMAVVTVNPLKVTPISACLEP